MDHNNEEITLNLGVDDDVDENSSAFRSEHSGDVNINLEQVLAGLTEQLNSISEIISSRKRPASSDTLVGRKKKSKKIETVVSDSSDDDDDNFRSSTFQTENDASNVSADVGETSLLLPDLKHWDWFIY